MNFSSVKGITIPEGNVQVISVNGQVIWQAIKRMEWTQSNITIGSFNTVVYANGLLVAGSGISSGLYYSTDGQTWTQSNITNSTFNSVAYANGLWVAGSSRDGLYYSTDGQTWTQSNITSGHFGTIAYANGLWVAGSSYNGGLYYSNYASS